jgi:hypothetical protein
MKIYYAGNYFLSLKTHRKVSRHAKRRLLSYHYTRIVDMICKDLKEGGASDEH